MPFEDNTLFARDLNSTSSRYDRFRASPDEDDRQVMWLIWVLIAGCVALLCLTLIGGILWSARARKNPFNIYLLFLTIPDAFFSGMCSITCALNYAAGHYHSSPMCEWQSWYTVFGFTANSWMNGVIAHQLHQLLKRSKEGKRYFPPTRRQVMKHSALVYVYSAFVASWTLIPFLPHQAWTTAGLACLPTEYSLASTLFFWLAFVPAFIGIPLVYSLYIFWNVYRNKMLPITGRTRLLALYFARLSAVFVLMWLPTVILLFAMGTPNVWVAWAGGTWSHLQGFVSAWFAVQKPDVRRAVKKFLRCEADRDKSQVDKSPVNKSPVDSNRPQSRKSRPQRTCNWQNASVMGMPLGAERRESGALWLEESSDGLTSSLEGTSTVKHDEGASDIDLEGEPGLVYQREPESGLEDVWSDEGKNEGGLCDDGKKGGASISRQRGDDDALRDDPTKLTSSRESSERKEYTEEEFNAWRHRCLQVNGDKRCRTKETSHFNPPNK